MKAKTVKEVLVAARWIIENVGWCQWHFAKSGDKEVWMGRRTTIEKAAQEAGVSKVDCFCALGAINAVEADYDLKRSAAVVIDNHTGGSVSTWNDTDGRTKEEVLDLFDRAIKGTK